MSLLDRYADLTNRSRPRHPSNSHSLQEELRRQVREGFAQIERGDYLEFASNFASNFASTEEILSHVKQEGRKRVASKEEK